MTFAERTLPSAVIEALTYQPTITRPATTTPVDLAVLLPFSTCDVDHRRP
jgi:hypothetical protein